MRNWEDHVPYLKADFSASNKPPIRGTVPEESAISVITDSKS